MKAPGRTFTILLVALVLGMFSSTALAAVTWDSEAQDDTLIVGAIEARSHRPPHEARTGNEGGALVRNCVPIGNGQLRCYVADGVGGFVQAVSVTPGAPPVTTADIALQLETEFRRLPIAPGGIEIQPPDGWTLVNVETIVFTRAQEQVFQTAVLGVPVTVRATPTRFLWTFGDGSPPLVTRDPGAPWPDATVSHRYRTAGSRTITLSTEWAGEFRVAGGGAWIPIAGVARTNDQAPPLDVRALTNTLVTP